MKRCAIVGGGISGLSAAYFLRKHLPELDIDLYESSSRIGGVVRTEILDGCILEAGPDSFLTQKKAAANLCKEIGLETSLTGSNDSTRKTGIFHEGELKVLPEGLMLMVPTKFAPFITTDLLSWPGKLEALGDLFSLPQETDCTVADFLESRFGSEILERIAEPMISGIYGADVNRLSLQAALPQIWEIQKKGSLMLSFLRARRKAKPSGESLFTTLGSGMESLVEKLKDRCSGVKWKTSTPVRLVERARNSWGIDGVAYHAVVLANASPPELPGTRLQELRSLIHSVRRNSAIVISLGFGSLSAEGFGWLVPSSERRSVLAATYVSNKFPGRSPHDRFLVRMFIGGDQAAHWIQKEDQEIYREARSELRRIADIVDEPLFYRVYRWKNAMPEYAAGHLDKVRKMQELIEGTGLFLAGNLYSGVGIPDCISHSERTAQEVCKYLEDSHPCI